MTLMQPGSRIVKIPLGTGGGFQTPTIPDPQVGDVPIIGLYPDNRVGSQDRYRPWDMVVSEGVPMFANGWDNPWLWDKDNFPNEFLELGSTRPTTFVLALVNPDAGWLKPGEDRRYYTCYREPNLGRETAPQVQAISNNGITTDDVLVSDTALGPPTGFTHVSIYRDTLGDATPHLVAVVPWANMPYTDNTPDSGILLNRAIVLRLGSVPPPIFAGLAAYQGQVFGWDGNTSNLYFSQVARADGEFVSDDFNPIPVQIGSTDNFGAITAVMQTYSSLVIFKKRAAYELLGSDASTFQARILFDDRGAVSFRAFVAVDNFWVFLDERGLMIWTPGAEPIPAGSTQENRDNPLSPIWQRMNRDASNLMHLVHREEDSTVEAYIALDNDPVPNYRVIYNYRLNIFSSVDTEVVSLATGILDDAAGAQHHIRLDDLGYVWQEYVGNSQGVFLGTLTSSIQSKVGNLITIPDPDEIDEDLDGVVAAPYDVYSPDGEVVAVNRVAHVISPTEFQSVYIDVSQPGNDLAFGVIPASYWSPLSRFEQDGRIFIARFFIEHNEEDTISPLLFETQSDLDGWVRKREIPLDQSEGHSIVPVADHAFRWQYRFSMRYPGMDFEISAIYIEWKTKRMRERNK
jgi:hypothetical protein